MKNSLSNFLPTHLPNYAMLVALAALTLGAGLTTAATGQLFWLGLPAIGLLGWLAVVDFRKLFFLLLGTIPFSMEVELPGGFGTDLPTEPLIVALLGIGLLYFLKNMSRVSGAFLRHPITLFLLAHVAWIVLTALFSESPIISLKYVLAKIWYIAVFYFMAAAMLKTERDLRQLVWWMLPGLVVTILYCTAIHSTYGFTFKDVNHSMWPFYRNKVMYSSLLAVVFPFIWLTARATPQGTTARRWLIFGIVLCLVGIQLSYTRAAYLVIILAYFLYQILRLRQMRLTLGITAAFFALLVGFLVSSNRYLDFAPNYEKTVTQTKFDNLLTSTFQMRDISTMERVYRWVAGFRMIGEKPMLGFGPGTFTFFYDRFTVHSFKTYVSNNKERSGIHCYYLLMAVEQGIIGFVIFIGFSGFVMLFGEKTYHQTADPSRRRSLLMAWLSFVIIALLMLMNDLVETDKVGSFFFICCAVMVNVDLENRRKGIDFQ